ncbi:MAG TPA: uroporphyrinogen decarboxylase [Myxococcales bacterium]|nr:uroporphyrinogen decarboxylase [Myxococcales bacterium]
MPEPRFLRACRGEPVDATPVWFMRQAGRYLPEYRAIRERHDFLTMARTPEVAAEVTLQPVRRLGVDAAILFADILLPLPPMGAPLRFAEGEGPVIDRPVRSRADVERLRVADAGELGYVGEALKLVRRELPPEVALIGFAGAPFTLASYLIEGGHSKSFERTKALMWGDPATWNLLLGKLAETCVAYLKMQIGAGAQAVQLFDSWVGCLAPADYEACVLPHTARVFAALRGLNVPTLHFGTDTATLLPLLARAGGDVIGVDWRCPLGDARRLLGPERPLQGNLDPVALLATPEAALAAARRVLAEGRGGPHVFNTGHGLLPQTPPELVKRIVELVHEESTRTG